MLVVPVAVARRVRAMHRQMVVRANQDKVLLAGEVAEPAVAHVQAGVVAVPLALALMAQITLGVSEVRGLL